MKLLKTLEIRGSPHIASGSSTEIIMFNVVLALLPAAFFAIARFGLTGLLTLLVAVVSCVFTEHFLCRWSGRTTTIGDWSAAVTGLLYGMTLPPSLPLWMNALGGIVAVGVAKSLFGGLGCNCFNPALVGRAFLQAAFPAAMTYWPELAENRFTSLPGSTLTLPFLEPTYDVLSGATPLSQWKFDHIATGTTDLFLGSISGSTGETSACLILLGGLYLAIRRMLNWRIPVAIMVTVAASSLVLQWLDSSRYAGPIWMLFSGGLMLGAVFMATDMVASPMTSTGCVVYGTLIGLLIVVIRVWGGMPEGVMFAILLGNAVSPHIDNWFQPTVYGAGGLPLSRSTAVAARVSVQLPGTGVDSGRSQLDELHSVSAQQVTDRTSLKESANSRPSGNSITSDSRSLPMITTLLVAGFLCGLAIVSVYLLTRPIILQNQIARRQEAVFSILPGATSSQAFRWTGGTSFEPVPQESDGQDVVYAGYDKENRLVGIAVTGKATGYQDIIHLAYGYSFDSQTIMGFQVLSSRETPGLGDRVETDAGFLRNFDRLDVQVTSDGARIANPIQFVKPGTKEFAWQIDGVSGATITSRTVVKILSESSQDWVPKLWQHRSVFQKGGQQNEL